MLRLVRALLVAGVLATSVTAAVTAATSAASTIAAIPAATATYAATSAHGMRQARISGLALQRSQRGYVRGMLLSLGPVSEPHSDLVDDSVHRWNKCILPTPVPTLSVRRELSRIEQPQWQHPCPLPSAPVSPVTTAATAAAAPATAATDAAATAPGLRHDNGSR